MRKVLFSQVCVCPHPEGTSSPSPGPRFLPRGYPSPRWRGTPVPGGVLPLLSYPRGLPHPCLGGTPSWVPPPSWPGQGVCLLHSRTRTFLLLFNSISLNIFKVNWKYNFHFADFTLILITFNLILIGQYIVVCIDHSQVGFKSNFWLHYHFSFLDFWFIKATFKNQKCALSGELIFLSTWRFRFG